MRDENITTGWAAARTAFIYAAVVLALAVVLFVLWRAAVAFFLIFGGILLAAAFDGTSRLLGRVLPLGRRWRVLLSVLLIGGVLGVALFFGAQALISQFSQLTDVIDEQMGRLQDWLIGVGLLSEDPEEGPGGLFPSASAVFGGATSAVLTFFGGLGNFIILIFLGVFFAMEPHLYKRGLVTFVPPRHRQTVSDALHEAGVTLRGWLVGQTISMSIIFLVSLAVLMAIGMPFAFLLAVQAGLLVFIPLLGPVLAGVPIVLAGVSESPTMALWGLGAYGLIQTLESNIIQPVVQQRTVSLPPAMTLSLQLVLGVLFGLLGVALAVPLGASLRAIIDRTYVYGTLGGPWEGDDKDDG